MNETKVSVAMATFNGAKHIRDQLASLTQQTLIPAELVITDDRSTDETVSIVNDFARTAPFPVIIHSNSTRLGFRANFLKASALTSSALVAFCDQDDKWYPTKLKEAVGIFSD